MRMIAKRVVACSCAAVLAFPVVGCAAPGQQPQEKAESAQGTQDVPGASTRDAANPTADGRIDVTSKGTQVATYHGAKYIVSDVTVDQATGDAITEGLGLQEICVVNQPDAWEYIESIGWDRNSISYTKITMPWGNVSYRYGYINEASGVAGIEEWSQTSEDRYFANMSGVEHLESDGHSIAYVYDNSGEDLAAMGIPDLEAGMSDGDAGNVARASFAVYTYEQRDEKCAFVVSINCEVTDESAAPSAEEIVRGAYAPLQFEAKDKDVEAASFLSDIAITNQDGSEEVIVSRVGDDLIAYTEHTALMLGVSNVQDIMATTTYDFAPQQDAPDGANNLEIDGKTVFATTNDYAAIGWVDLGKGTLRVETNILDGEDIQSALTRAISGRLS